ncbi:MAG: nitrous oxide reductase family maturation protein NosD [bacterium]
MRRLCIYMLFTAVSLLCAASLHTYVYADILEVGMAGYAYDSIQGALDAASDHDTILVHPGVYVENINFKGKPVLVTGEDPEDPQIIADTVIDGNQTESVVVFDSDEDERAVMSGFTITNGKGMNGGGIRSENASPVLRNCIVRDNRALSQGGGIYCSDSSSPTIIACEIRHNEAAYSGGGIYGFYSSPTITACRISHNVSHGTVAYAFTGGGGIYCYASPNVTITACVIESNHAEADGGGIFCVASSPDIIQCDITRNDASHGGGIACAYNSSPCIIRCRITGNTAAPLLLVPNTCSGGGAICEGSPLPTLINVSFRGNTTMVMGQDELCVSPHLRYSRAKELLNQVSGSRCVIQIRAETTHRWKSCYRFFGRPCGGDDPLEDGDPLHISLLQE